MMLSMDEIYDLFIWDASYSDEEYASRVNQGIAESAKLKNIFPFIQPLIVPQHKSKSVWEPCARVIAMRTDEELRPYLVLLFEWLQDMNWPGAGIIFDRLAMMPQAEAEDVLKLSKCSAEQSRDTLWLRALNDFEVIISSPKAIP